MKNPDYMPPISSGTPVRSETPLAAPARSVAQSSGSTDLQPNVSTYSDYSTVAALFPDRADAERAIENLKASAVYDPSEIGVAMRDRREQKELVHQTGTHATEGAVSGALGGGILGGLAGWLIAAGALTIPGIGPVVAGGALASALGITAGTAAVGAGIGVAAGGITGALIGLGIPEKDAAFYDKGFREGGVIVTVRARSVARAAEILAANNGSISGGGVVSKTPSTDEPSAVRYP